MGMVKTVVRMALLLGEVLDGILRALQAVLPGLKEPSAFVTFLRAFVLTAGLG